MSSNVTSLGSEVKKWCDVTLIQQSQDSRGLVVQFQECTQAALSSFACKDVAVIEVHVIQMQS
jgi:hypothetical protein